MTKAELKTTLDALSAARAYLNSFCQEDGPTGGFGPEAQATMDKIMAAGRIVERAVYPKTKVSR